MPFAGWSLSALPRCARSTTSRTEPRAMNRFALTLLLSLVLAACGRGRAVAPPAGDAVVVRVAPVSVDRIAPPVTASGTLGAKEEVTLSFKVGGVVSRIFVDEGRAVRAGDTLAELDLSEIDAAVARARSAAEKAERDLTRARRLYADSVATLEQAQNAQTGRDVAHAELETAVTDGAAYLDHGAAVTVRP